jgi:diadenosine tetraphosphate (Ap4A) HIT family hydrolase
LSQASLPDWDDLIAGRVCPLCDRAAEEAEESEYGFRVAQLRVSSLELQKDQAPRGYCLLMMRRHAVELYDLAPREVEGWALDLRAAARAAAQVFECDKMNYLMLGNVFPHLHSHLWPRYRGEPQWRQPLPFPPPGSPHYLTAPEYGALVARLRAALPPWGGTE